jgi:hypothetical protein
VVEVKLFGIDLNFRQAVVEILIIVVGVLIALGIDSWNNNRIDRNIEAEYLFRLAEDAAYNADQGIGVIKALERKRAKLDQLAKIASNSQTTAVVDSKTVLALIGAGTDLGWSFPDFRTNTFDELTSTGRLSLIKDIALRTAITNYDAGLRDTVGRVNARRTEYPSYVYTLLQPEQMIELSDLNSALPNIDANVSMGDRVTAAIVSSEFEGLLNAERNYAEFAVQLMTRRNLHSKEILQLLNQAMTK